MINAVTEKHWVYQSIINWSEFSEDKSKLLHVLDRGADTMFFLRGIVREDVHAYLGYFDNQLFLHLIPASIDLESNFEDLDQIPSEIYSSMVCKIDEVGPIVGPIDDRDAIERIANWREKEKRAMALEKVEFYQVFHIPEENFKYNFPFTINFALRQEQDSGQFIPDLVLSYKNKSVSFLDTCRPVPPFKYSEESTYGLLTVLFRERG